MTEKKYMKTEEDLTSTQLTHLNIMNRLLNEKYRFTEYHFRECLIRFYQMFVNQRGYQMIHDPLLYKNFEIIANKFSKDNQSNKGLFISGRPGNGKSTMLKALSSTISLFSRLKYFNNTQLTMPVVVANDYEKMNYYKKAPILGIDDLGTDANEVVKYGNLTNPFSEVIEYRYEKQLFTLVSSNIPPKRIQKIYEGRIADRFNEMFDIIIFEAKSFRGQLIKLKEIK